MKNKKIEKISKLLSFIIFFGILVILPLFTVFLPKEKFSETENRNLAKMPKLSAESVFNRKYMNGLETYIADHFVLRTEWIKGKTKLELLEGKKESGGVFILKDKLLQRFDKPNLEEVDKSINAINNFASDNNTPVYVMIAPTSTGIYSNELPDNAPVYDQKKFISDSYSKLSHNITALDVYTPLVASREEYIFYRNDHHWTSLGAYISYASTIKKLGFAPVDISKFDIEHASDDFKGTLYSKALYDKIPADTIEIYHYSEGTEISSVEINTGMGIETYDSIYFRDYLDKKDKYSTFCGSNQPIVTIKTDSDSGQKLLMFKDSYAHCFVPFLAQHYSEITMIDLRYVNTPYSTIVNIKDYNAVLFLYNAGSFAEDTNVKKLDIKE